MTTVVSEDEARGIRRKLVVRGRKLVGGLLFGDLSKSDKIRDGVERGVELPLAQHVAAPNYVELMEMLVDALAAGA